ncbi:MAG: class I SAM-dependent methyltransferase [Paenibacillaceae bacterium]
MALDTVLQYAQRIVASIVKPGDFVVDATVGQGHDTIVLAQLVGEAGKVYGFDIQEAAIAIARDRIHATLGSNHAVNWVHGSHAFMLKALPTDCLGQVRAIMFNLGYLPGYDHQITTRSQSTLTGLNAAALLLQSGGVITIVAYTGHEGAQEEADAVEHWASALPQKQFNVLTYRFINQLNHPPFLIVVEKK